MHVLIQWIARLVCALLLAQVPASLAAVSLPFKLFRRDLQPYLDGHI
ncbi:hypothetical protein [Pseudomonas sp. MUP55]|nr:MULTISPECIES: hypothetical protein [unclassified Pseudomonas]WPN91760.1 hypothetical protein SC319_21385 [Pseudomonas sp. MUP56]WPN97287.1 hypothetical protein SC318_21390 [Pseudomonas sp. MUP55]